MKFSSVNTQAYFDCNATTPVLQIAAEAAQEAMRILYGNPSSAHLVGLQAKQILESTRKLAAQVLNAVPEEITFTSGATEAAQTAIFSVLNAYKNHPTPQLTKVLYGSTEHKVIPQSLKHWVKVLGLPLEIVSLPVDSHGQIQMSVLRRELPHALLVCTMAVNNETGVIQNLSLIEQAILELNPKAFWLVDSVQGLGKVPLDFKKTRIDYAPFSGHKLYAPKGIGFLYARKSVPLTPLLVGGGQEKGLRSGTENLPGVAALGAVLEQLLAGEKSTMFFPHKTLLSYRTRLIQELKQVFPKIEFNTPFEFSVPTTINFSVPGFCSAELLDLFDSAGLRISAGSACSAKSAEPSYVLDAMGVPEWRSVSAIRLSFGPCTTEEEIQRGCQIFRQSAMALQNTCLLETQGSFQAPDNLKDGILQLKSGSSNSWMIVDKKTRSCIVIDPCESVAERIENYVHCQNLDVLAILDTHSHADHDSIRPTLQKILQSNFKSGGKTFDSLGWPKDSSSKTIQVNFENGVSVPALLLHEDLHQSLVLALLPTPGHTSDSRTFILGYAKDGKLGKKNVHFAFTGDTILGGGLGRTNFSMSDPEKLFHSLRNIQDILNDQTLLCPAHDYTNSFATTLETEKQENSLLSLALAPITPLTLDSFILKKKEIDSELASLEQNFQGIVCGVTPSSQTPCADITITAENLGTFLSQTPQPIIIDVRENQEYALFQEWDKMGFSEAPRNVPLSRFVNFMGELMTQKHSQREILLICKTGTRSLQVAKSLRRLGFSQAWNLGGGIALAIGLH